MKVIELQSYGTADALHLVERPKPIVGPGQVLVRIATTTFNPIDLKRASGDLKGIFPLQFPFIPGGDFSGVIEAVGADVSGRSVEELVYGYSAEGGAYAEWIAVDAGKVASKPANLDHAEAASLALVGQTAMQAIEAADLTTGQTLFMLGAGGAVGAIVVQLARHLGATVIGTASARDISRLRAAGAEPVDRDAPFEQLVSDVDAVIDAVGGDAQARAFGVLKKGGVLVAISQPPSQDEAARRGVRAIMLATNSSTKSLDALRTRIEAGDIVPHLGRHYPLSEVPQAWRDAAQGSSGKIIINVGEVG